MTAQQGFPQISLPFVAGNGQITQTWLQLLINLWNRTGGGTGTNFAPADAGYVVKAANAGIPNAHVATNSTSISWDFSVSHIVKANVILSSIVIPENQVENLITDLANRVVTTTEILAGTGLSGGGSLASNVTLSIANNGVTNSLLAEMPTLTLKGNNTVGTADALDLTVAQVTSILDLFTDVDRGLVPDSGGGTINYLRADATFNNPLSGGVTGVVTLAALSGIGTTGSLTFTNGLITSFIAPT